MTIINEKFIISNVIVSITQNHTNVKENDHMRIIISIMAVLLCWHMIKHKSSGGFISIATEVLR